MIVETLRRDLNLAIQEKELMQAGQHAFAFTFNVPSNVAPLHHSEEAHTLYEVHATASSLGRLGKDLTAARWIWLAVNHSGRLNGPPPAYHNEVQIHHDRFGPSLFEVSAKHFIIGGYLRFWITWPAKQLPFKILEITMDIVQNITFKASLSVSAPVERRQVKRRIYNLSEDGTAASEIKQYIEPDEQETKISCQARIPFDAGPHLIPTTHPDTQTCVLTTSDIVLSIIYERYQGGKHPSPEQRANPEIQILEIESKGAILSACVCKVEHTVLPSYAAQDGAIVEAKPKRASQRKKQFTTPAQCLCWELGEAEQKEYGVSNEEVKKRWKDEEEGRIWLQNVRRKREREQEQETVLGT